MNEANYKRSKSITVLCIILASGLIILAAKIFKYFLQPADLYLCFLVVAFIIISIVCFGLWKMKKWAVHLYSIYALLIICFTYIVLGKIIYSQIIPSILVMIVCFSNIKKMT